MYAITYTYGASTDTSGFNRKGRLVMQEDGSGRQEFKYGRQGELTEVSRTLVIPNQAVATYTTRWNYDSWNRLRGMTYPDGEVVNYSYNTGGLLKRVVGGKAGESTIYVDSISYDKFEQRSYIKYGNGTETNYSYKPENRLLNTLSVQKGSVMLMNNQYAYDAVHNVTGVVNSGVPGNTIGGSMTHRYYYDDLYRLDSASGDFMGDAGKKARYSLSMSYDKLHNITHKKQDIVQNGIKFGGILNAGYDLSYAYAGNSQQIANIAEQSYRAERSSQSAYQTGIQAGDAVNSKTQCYSYDANGNMTFVATGKLQEDSTLQAISTRQLLWDEENRLLAVSDNGFVSNYWYDAAGERTVKQSFDNEGVFINGVLSAGRTSTGKFTAYISPYLVVNNGGYYSKHIYMGSERITSKVGNSGIFSSSPVEVLEQQAKYTLQTGKIKERFDSLGVQYKGIQQTGGLVSSNPSPGADLYFYHPDHLGSSSLITDLNGTLVQHIQYVPFGEVFVEETKSAWSTPYKFNAKELDDETGLYYYGARYYDPKTSVWLSVDPLAEKFHEWSSYVYCNNNPIRIIDPTGLSGEDTSGKPSEVNKTTGVLTAAQSSVRTIEPKEKIAPCITLNPDFGEIRQADALTSAEMWMNSPSTSGVEAVGKIAANIGYSLVNSPYSLLTGQSLGGTPLNSVEKQDAFIDVVPGLLSGGLTKTKAVIKTTEKGIKGFNQFVKSSGAANTKGLPTGMLWQKNASKLYKANSINQKSLSDLEKFRNYFNLGSTTKKELKK